MLSGISADRPSQALGVSVRRAYRSGGLVVQPRMGFSDPATMRRGLIATREATANTIGTITLDSYTRTGDYQSASRALENGGALNGYPLVTHSPATTRAVVDGIGKPDFPIQVRHGSARPQRIIMAMAAAGLAATEGGPVSYCLPYGRVPLRESIANWKQSCDMLAAARCDVGDPHVETFGGCMMGQLCPPSLLVAISILEALFFWHHGIRSISLSYAQQANQDQDVEAITALRALARRYVPADDQHVVIYAYMGVYPATVPGARALLTEAARLASRTASERLIVKTVAEAYRIPTIPENVEALETAAAAASVPVAAEHGTYDSEVGAEAAVLIERVLDLSPEPGEALASAFERGYLDVPYCLHPDNAGRSASYIGEDGRLRWSSAGSMPIGHLRTAGHPHRMSSADLLAALGYVARKFDQMGALSRSDRALPPAAG